jgi:thiol-disulfide isomerase/thioredoxin
MIKAILILTLYLLFWANMDGLAQTITIELNRREIDNEAVYNSDSFYFSLNKRLYPPCNGEILQYKLISKKTERHGDCVTTTTTHELPDLSLGIIADMFGHEVILIPSDTIRIDMVKEPVSFDKPMPWTRKFSFSGKNRFIHCLFDSLSYVTDDVMSHMLSPKDKAPAEFMQLVERRFNNRMQFLNGYSRRHNIPSKIVELVFSEIYSAYVKDLVFLQAYSFFDGGSADIRHLINPKIDFDQLKTVSFLKTVSAEHVIYQYFLLMHIPLTDGEFYTKDRLLSVYRLIKRNYSGSTRDNLLSSHIANFIQRAYHPNMDDVITEYKQDCKNLKVITYVDSLFQSKKKLLRLTLSDVLETKVQSLEGNFNSMNSIVAGKPTLIDCWASWCKPCIAEFPFSKNLEEAYGERINFVYFSFDKDIQAWKSKSAELNMKSKNFLVTENFKSIFSAYFDLTSIPRYILLDVNGKLVSKDAPRPSNAKLKALLDSLL